MKKKINQFSQKSKYAIKNMIYTETSAGFGRWAVQLKGPGFLKLISTIDYDIWATGYEYLRLIFFTIFHDFQWKYKSVLTLFVLRKNQSFMKKIIHGYVGLIKFYVKGVIESN